jgi:hypothetical protein
MQTTNKRFYSPQFSQLAAVSVRRLAWAMGKPMPAAVEFMVKLMPSIVEPSRVCLSCKDQSGCQACAFNNLPATSEALKQLAAL